MTAKRTTSAGKDHPWEFKARFRQRAFGWKSRPAITRIKQAVSEIKKVARKDPVVAAEGAVMFLERVSAAIEQVDGSSGSIGTAVDNAIAELAPVIARAPADARTRETWLERLFEAHAADKIPYIECLTDHWGDLCVSKGLASAWADRLIGITRMALNPDGEIGSFFHGTSACLSALYHAERYDEVITLLNVERTLWTYQQWAAKALAAQGRKAEALHYAESCRSPYADDLAIDRLCEEILLSSGLRDEAYRRYGLRANLAGTYLATFRAITKKYHHKAPDQILADIVEATPGDEGKWFAAAKDAGLYDEALDLASRTPCDPRTLARAARDFGEKQPAFALGAGLLSLKWIILGYGYEITSADVFDAYGSTMAAAERSGTVVAVKDQIRKLLDAESGGGFVRKVLGRELGP